MSATRLLIAPALIAASLLVVSPSAASADDFDPSTVRAAQLDEPFHYATGDHLTGSREVPTTRRYGSGRPVFLVGDSMAGQLADGLRRSTAGQHRALLPRTKSGGTFRLPAGDSPSGRWSARVRNQIRAEARDGRRPIVVLAGRGLGTSTQIRSTVWRLRADGATVHLVTASPLPAEAAALPSCVVASSSPMTRCRFRLTDADAGRSATLTAARQASPRISVLDLTPLAARGSGPTYSPVHTGTDGPVQIYRGVSNHLTATWSREVLAGRLATLTR
ncbi:hypothetical protein M3697_11040 [Janibacter melonis]|uniref:SGNH hydrolase domain-containing protein n=1 Tax=Janibacter melonis TaxID=262209 RepID=UPI00204338C6|nr:SGNH hydrolase domain-containing protein [Janibacter melonis]MCM3555638.1 hypothetical protein [Janibacter melonis]